MKKSLKDIIGHLCAPFFIAALLLPYPARANFYAAAWNLESGDSDPVYLAEQIRQWATIPVWGFSEIENQSVLIRMCEALNTQNSSSNFVGILGNTGRTDRLGVAFDQAQFSYVTAYELPETNIGNTLRASLVVHLREISSGQEFLFVANHLYRGKSSNETRRDLQAAALRDWAAVQELPVIAVGDFNLDCDVDNLKQCNNTYRVLTQNEVFSWVVPENPIKTQCSNRYNSILDFVFVTGSARDWASSSFILNRDDEACIDDDKKSDHRPVGAFFKTDDAGICVEAQPCQ